MSKIFSLDSLILISSLVVILDSSTPLDTHQSLSNVKPLLDLATKSIQNASQIVENNDCLIGVRFKMAMDCEELYKMGFKESGSYSIWPRNRIMKDKSIDVYCDMTTDGGGWTVFQKRGDFGRNKDFFFKVWDEYKSGFGRISEDFWLGNDAIYAISNQRAYSLKVDMMDLEKNKRYALYDSFWIDNEENAYTLHLNDFSGNAGDSLTGHSNFKFTTKDRDNDIYEGGNCANLYKGGWWYGQCHSSNLNGLYLNGTHSTYADGIEWSTWKGQNYSLPFVEMKIRSFNYRTNIQKQSTCKEDIKIPTKMSSTVEI